MKQITIEVIHQVVVEVETENLNLDDVYLDLKVEGAYENTLTVVETELTSKTITTETDI